MQRKLIDCPLYRFRNQKRFKGIGFSDSEIRNKKREKVVNCHICAFSFGVGLKRCKLDKNLK
jgi:hypothetical protein